MPKTNVQSSQPNSTKNHPLKLSIKEVYKKCDEKIFNAKTTKDIEPLNTYMGQERVISALQIATSIQEDGYNVFAVGKNGIGKSQITKDFFLKTAKNKQIPKDYCYVHNFQNKDKPLFIEFNPSEAMIYQKDIKIIIKELKTIIPSTLKHNTYIAKIKTIEQETILKTTENIQKIQEDALKDNIGILQTKDGFALIILKENKKDQLTDEDFKNLPKKDQEELTKNLKKYQQKLEQIVISLPNKEQQKKDKIKKETHKILEDTVTPIFKTLEEKWKHNKKAVEHLKSIKAEIISHKEYFTHKEQLTPIKQEIDIYQNLMQEKTKDKYSLTNFEVNIITDNTQRLTNKEGCPVIALDTINYNNLFGKVEYNSEFGSFSTNFTLIKQGALHQANGGYLLMDIRKVLEVPYLWEHLKNALKTKKIQILNHDNFYGYSVSTIDPEPIPLNIKIILIGEPELYYGLSNYDNEFKDLFKIIADFNHEVEYSDENVKLYTSLASSIVKNHNLKHLDSKGLAYFVELGAKLTESQEYLSMEISSLINLLIEANYFTTNSNKTYISKDEINKAYKEQIFRSSKYHSYMQKQIQNKIINIETTGKKIGQINGLSVMTINNHYFGQPQRIACTVYSGKGDVIDIEKTVNLSGAIHSKGVLILSSFIHTIFPKHNPLSFSASISFEQSYGMIDGDSASSTELYCLLSALSETPINQAFAVTGSVDQQGKIQAIGGVNHKIEGYFDICQKRGLTGEHSVLIPKSNQKDLMLKQEVLDAIENNMFHIYAISTIEEGIELLTGITAGELNPKTKKYEEGSIYRKINDNWGKITCKKPPL